LGGVWATSSSTIAVLEMKHPPKFCVLQPLMQTTNTLDEEAGLDNGDSIKQQVEV
jgi:hypothetical protein